MNGRSDKLDLFVQEAGSGPTLVMLHAFPLTSDMWAPQIHALQATHRILAPDYRGFGRSPDVKGGETLDDFASDLLAQLDSRGIDRAVFIGLSMGGYVLFALLRLIAPERVRGIVLSDTRASADDLPARVRREAMARTAEQAGADAVADAMIGSLLGSTSRAERPSLVDHVQSIIRANRPSGIAAATRAMAGRPDSTPILPTLTFPALLMCGEEDMLTPPDVMQAMARAMPNAEFRSIERAGHLSNLEQPDRFNGLLIEWLDRIEDGRSD